MRFKPKAILCGRHHSIKQSALASQPSTATMVMMIVLYFSIIIIVFVAVVVVFWFVVISFALNVTSCNPRVRIQPQIDGINQTIHFFHHQITIEVGLFFQLRRIDTHSHTHSHTNEVHFICHKSCNNPSKSPQRSCEPKQSDCVIQTLKRILWRPTYSGGYWKVMGRLLVGDV